MRECDYCQRMLGVDADPSRRYHDACYPKMHALKTKVRTRLRRQAELLDEGLITRACADTVLAGISLDPGHNFIAWTMKEIEAINSFRRRPRKKPLTPALTSAKIEEQLFVYRGLAGVSQ